MVEYDRNLRDLARLKGKTDQLKRTPPQEVLHRLREDIGPSFDNAWERMRKGKPTLFVSKAGFAGLGAVLTSAGIYEVVSGMDEESEDLFLPEKFRGSNLVRLGTGLGTAAGGAAMLFLALTKGAPMIR